MKHLDYAHFKQSFLHLVTLDDTSARLALSFAVGLFISLSPLFGAHTIIGFACVILFKMNLPAMMLGVWINGPISAPFVYAGLYYFGRLIFAGKVIDVALPWTQILATHFEDVVIQVTIGWLSLGVAICLLSYGLLKMTIDAFRLKRHRRTESGSQANP
mgnify:CR=1 FL=1